MRILRYPLTVLFVLAFLAGGVLPSEEERELAITHGPYLLDAAEAGITVVWFTNKRCVSHVEFSSGDNFRTFPVWGGYPQKQFSSRHGLIEAYTFRHAVRLTGLEAGTAYRYRAVSREIKQFKPYEVLFGSTVVSDVFPFRTLDAQKKSFSFGVVTDVHENSQRLDHLLEQLEWEGIDLMFLNGDMIDYFEGENQLFQGFMDTCVQHFAHSIPLVYTRGNHETRGFLARSLLDYFPQTSGRFYTSFNHGPVHFIILDSGEDKPDDHPVYAGLVDFDRYRIAQKDWLVKDVASPAFRDALYRIVFIHQPPFSGEERHGISHITELWGPVLNKAGIDLVLSGHFHRDRDLPPREGHNSFPIVVQGTGTVIRVDVTGDELRITRTGQDGEVIGSRAFPSRK